mgnify:CR=1 FL=1
MKEVYVQRAQALRDRGYNCAQAVACTFSAEVGMDEQTLFRMLEGFGGGMGNHRATCGAVSGAAAIVGLLTSKGSVEAGTKTTTYERIGSLVDAFYEKNKSLVCREILGEDDGIVLQSCDGCVKDAVMLVHELLHKLDNGNNI